MIIICIVSVSGAIALSLMPNHWEKLEEKVTADATLLSELMDRPDRIDWRLSEDLTLSRAMLWDTAAKQRYPAPDGFTPQLYEFSEDETLRLTQIQAETTAPFWEWFNTSGSKLLYCSKTPAVCIIYDREALEEFFGFRQGTLKSTDHTAIWPIVLLALAIISGSAAAWLIYGSERGPSRLILLPDQHIAKRGTLEISLSPRDLKLLLLLEARNGAVVTKDELYDAGWGREFMPNSRALDQHMINLRRKLDPNKSRPVLIETVHGIGYRLRP